MDILERLNSIESKKNALEEKFGLSYNPFPKSGIAIINESDKVVEKLTPVDDKATTTIVNYISDALFSKKSLDKGSIDKYMSLIVRGDYGSGKTQTLMFIKFLLNNLKSDSVKPYVVYIDNPGQKLAELIGGIITQIGVENFRKYLWDIFIEYLDKNQDVKRSFLESPHVIQTVFHFDGDTPEPSLTSAVQNYKELVDAITYKKNAVEKKQLLQSLKDHMIKSYTQETESSVVASYFYDIISETIGISKSWDMLTSGSVKELDKREVNILKAIVNIVCKQLGYTDFFILIDEFEEITAERLKKTDIDNYLRNLRILIDREKNWCSVFAMTGKALEIIESYSPPLAGRIKGSIVDLKPLDINGFAVVVKNYLSVARINKDDNSLYPFDESGLDEMLQVKNFQLKGSPRFLLKLCYQLLQRACMEKEKGEVIDRDFVKKHIEEFLK